MTEEPLVKEEKTKRKAKFVVHKLSDPETLCHIDTWISTQCMPLDYILGGKGLPVRRLVEVYGDNSTGKSLLATAICAETQRIGGIAAYADCEIAQHPPRMETLGIKPDELLYCNPKTVDEVFEALDEYIAYRNNKFGKDKPPLTFVWDSVAAIATMDELERAQTNGTESKQYPRVAMALSQTLRQKVNLIGEENVLFLITNQTREKLGVFIGDGATTTGGKALKFYASVRIELETRGKIKDGKKIIGANVQATVVKNRLSAPYKTLLLPLYYTHGMDECEATLNLLIDEEIINHEKSSPWYSIKLGEEEVKFQKRQWTDIFINRFEDVVKLFEGLK